MSLDRLVAALDKRIGRVWWGEPDPAAIARTAAETEHRGFTLPPQLAALWARRNGFVLGKPHPSLPRDPIVAPGELPGVFDAAGGVLFVGAGDDALFSYFEDPQTAGHLVLGAISDIELLTLALSDGGVFLADLDRLDDGPLRAWRARSTTCSRAGATRTCSWERSSSERNAPQRSRRGSRCIAAHERTCRFARARRSFGVGSR